MFSFKFLRIYKDKKAFKKNKDIKFNKSNLNKWMNLTKKESNSYLKKRKSLLEEIRKEYKSIPKNDKKSL